jgi:hypothetical protein
MLGARHMVEVWDAEDAMRRRRRRKKINFGFIPCFV